MSFGQDKPVTVRFPGIARIHIHDLEIQGRDHISHRKRSPRVTIPGLVNHRNDIDPDLPGDILKLFDTILHENLPFRMEIVSLPKLPIRVILNHEYSHFSLNYNDYLSYT
jgi:hypothetical protein